MRSTLKKVDNMTISLSEFTSLQDVISYLNSAPDAGVITKNASHRTGDKDWAGTSTFDEALNLMKNGWTDKSKELEGELKKPNKEAQETVQVTRQRSVYDVVGGNCSVPRYLQGVPTSMIRQVRAVQDVKKQKIMTVNYSIGFNSCVTGQQITNNAVKCLTYVRRLEEQGIRVNLNIVWVSYEYTDYVAFLIPVKKSSERMSIAKAAFCLCNPAMLRRIGFALMEKDKNLREMKYGEDFKYGYGKSTADKEKLGKIFPDMEIYNAI